MVDLSRIIFTSKIIEASIYATHLHQGQVRKGTDIPYISHLFAVASLVMEAGGSVDEVVAAFLHDAVEDQGGEKTLVEIREKFGKNVAEIVLACSDDVPAPGGVKKPWKVRKEAYLEHVEKASKSVRLVSNADKLHNARAILADYQAIKDDIWSRFNASKEDILWYYRELADTFMLSEENQSLASALDDVVTRLEQIVLIDGFEEDTGADLFNEKRGGVSIHLTAIANHDGSFEFSGLNIYDLSENDPEDDDYEYWHSLNSANTRKMLVQLVKERFGGKKDAYEKFSNWLDEYGIEYSSGAWR